MNTELNPSTSVNDPFQSALESKITRRSFLKRTAATVLITIMAVNAFGEELTAQNGGSSSCILYTIEYQGGATLEVGQLASPTSSISLSRSGIDYGGGATVEAKYDLGTVDHYSTGAFTTVNNVKMEAIVTLSPAEAPGGIAVNERRPDWSFTLDVYVRVVKQDGTELKRSATATATYKFKLPNPAISEASSAGSSSSNPIDFGSLGTANHGTLNDGIINVKPNVVFKEQGFVFKVDVTHSASGGSTLRNLAPVDVDLILKVVKR